MRIVSSRWFGLGAGALLLSVAIGGALAAAALAGDGEAPPGSPSPVSNAKVEAEDNGLRLVLRFPTDPYVAGEWGSAMVELVNERTTAVSVSGTVCRPQFDLRIIDRQGDMVFSWAEYWLNTALGPGTHNCRGYTRVIEPGESLREDMHFVVEQPGRYDLRATVEMAEGTTLPNPGVPLRVDTTLVVARIENR